MRWRSAAGVGLTLLASVGVVVGTKVAFDTARAAEAGAAPGDAMPSLNEGRGGGGGRGGMTVEGDAMPTLGERGKGGGGGMTVEGDAMPVLGERGGGGGRSGG